MARESSQPTTPTAGQQQAAEPPVIETPDGRRLIAVLPSDSEVEQHASTDTVQELLAGNYSEDIVNEVS